MCGDNEGTSYHVAIVDYRPMRVEDLVLWGQIRRLQIIAEVLLDLKEWFVVMENEIQVHFD